MYLCAILMSKSVAVCHMARSIDYITMDNVDVIFKYSI